MEKIDDSFINFCNQMTIANEVTGGIFKKHEISIKKGFNVSSNAQLKGAMNRMIPLIVLNGGMSKAFRRLKANIHMGYTNMAGWENIMLYKFIKVNGQGYAIDKKFKIAD